MMDQVPGIAYRFRDPELLQAALTHRSSSRLNNERLEFLGVVRLGRLVRNSPELDGFAESFRDSGTPNHHGLIHGMAEHQTT